MPNDDRTFESLHSDAGGGLWAYAAGPARNTTPLQGATSRPLLAQTFVGIAGAAGAVAAIALGFYAANPKQTMLLLVGGVPLVIGAVLFIGAVVLAGNELSRFLVQTMRVIGSTTRVASLVVSGISCSVALLLLVLFSAEPQLHRSLFAVAVVAIIGAVSGELAAMSAPPLISVGRQNGLTHGTVSAVLFFAGLFLALTATLFALARNGITQNIPTALTLFALLFGWTWAVHRDGIKRRDEFEDALAALIVAVTTGRDRAAAAFRLESVIVRQERRLFATTPPPLSDPLRATLFYSVNDVTGLVPDQLTVRQQQQFQEDLPPGAFDRWDVVEFLQRLRHRALTGPSGVAARDTRRRTASEPGIN